MGASHFVLLSAVLAWVTTTDHVCVCAQARVHVRVRGCARVSVRQQNDENPCNYFRAFLILEILCNILISLTQEYYCPTLSKDTKYKNIFCSHLHHEQYHKYHQP